MPSGHLQSFRHHQDRYLPPYADEEERNFKEVVEMKKNVAQFNSELEWEMIGIPYDEVSGCYL